MSADPVPADPVSDRFAGEVEALRSRLGAAGAFARTSAPVVLFGSSTIRLWADPVGDIGRDDVIAVGFGGARLTDLDRHYAGLVAPIGPASLVIAAGANDLEQDGADPSAIVARVAALVAQARGYDATLPIAVFTMKPAPVHRERLDRMRAVNAALADHLRDADATRGVRLIDGFTPLLGPDGLADPACYLPDRRHFNADGYRVWGRAIAAALEAMALDATAR